MSTIPLYPRPNRVLTGEEQIAAWQDGRQVSPSVNDVSAFASTVAVQSVEPLRDQAVESATRAESASLAAMLAVADGVYQSVADGLASTTDGQGFYAIDDDGGLALWINNAGTGRKACVFTTRASLRNLGINLWEEAKWNGSTDQGDMIATTAAIQQVMEDAQAWGVGLVNCGGRDKTYVCGGPAEQQDAQRARKAHQHQAHIIEHRRMRALRLPVPAETRQHEARQHAKGEDTKFEHGA